MKGFIGNKLSKFMALVMTMSLMVGISLPAYGDEALNLNKENAKVVQEVNGILDYYQGVEALSDWEEVIALYASGYEFSDTALSELGLTGDSFREKSTASFYGSRIMALMAIGVDPRNFDERDLLEELTSKMDESGSFGTITDQLYAVLALEVLNTPYERTQALDVVLGAQNEDGGFGFAADSSDLDTTATALLVLAHFKGLEDVDQAIEEAVAYIKPQQIETGGFTSWGSENSNSIARTISGLVAAGEDIFSDQWLKEGKSMVDALLAYALEDHSYTWQLEPSESSRFSTKQVLMAYADLVNGQSAYHYLRDIEQTVTIDMRIEGVTTNIIDDSYEITYIGEQLTTKDVLVEILEDENISYDIQSGTYGDYLYEIADINSGQFGGYDGWLYTINGTSGAGINVDTVENGDELLFYYGEFGAGTLIPNVTIKSTDLGIGEGLVIQVSATYDAYDENWNPTPVTIGVSDALVLFNDKTYKTNGTGVAYIPADQVPFDEIVTYKVSKEVVDSVPALVRTGDMTTQITFNSEKDFYDDAMISSWAKEAVYEARATQVMIGSENVFNPGSKLSKAELTTLLMRLSTFEITDYGTNFEDVKDHDWFYPYVSTGAYFNVLIGESDNQFKPSDLVTRAAFAEMVALIFELENNGMDAHYTDISELDLETQGAINAVSDIGLFIGDGTNFHPEGYVTREMAAVVAMRIAALEQ